MRKGDCEMKKDYCKPLIAFESFELTESIAQDCGKDIGPSDVQSCAYDIPGIGKIFIGDAQCTLKVTTDGEYGLCYHIPIESRQLFNS